MDEGNLNLYIHHVNSDDVRKITRKLRTLKHLGEAIMSLISDFAAKQKEYNDKMSQSMEGLKGDLDGLQAKIQKLQETQGELSDEDKAAIEELASSGQQMADKLAQLDELNAPEVPVEGE